jgi:hypothetical protein
VQHAWRHSSWPLLARSWSVIGTPSMQAREKRLARIRSPEVRRGRPLFAELPKSGTQPSARLPKAEADEMGLDTQIEP